jgi:predicted O-linked N-acetylglucosamine transferase (SPINDLY family)
MIEASVAPMPAAAFSREARPLRVGIMSPDFRQHSVAFFTEPLLRHIDRTRFELRAYSSTAEPDATTARLKPLFSAWIDAAAMGDALLAKRIRDDRVDVLIDLAGLTHGGRPGVLAVRPAPLSITYCGYPNSTGLTRVDARVVDSITDPPGSDASATESLLRIDPCFLCYQGDPAVPIFDTLASDRAGHVTFASFNVLSKINDATLRLWAAVLRATPNARLLIKSRGLDNASTRERFTSLLAQHGIADRTELLPQTKTLAEHLATYGRVDVALDTFPYHGTTTTCEALWMGVPVVTLTGQTHASRVGASLLHAVGLDDLVCASESGFAGTAAALAAHIVRRLDLRRSLRPRMLASPLCDAPGFAARFWNAVQAAYVSARDRAGASA